MQYNFRSASSFDDVFPVRVTLILPTALRGDCVAPVDASTSASFRSSATGSCHVALARARGSCVRSLDETLRVCVVSEILASVRCAGTSGTRGRSTATGAADRLQLPEGGEISVSKRDLVSLFRLVLEV